MIKMDRHYFWTNFYVRNIQQIDNDLKVQYVENTTEKRYGFDLTNFNLKIKKRTILRNLVNPQIGKYLLDQSKIGIKPIFNFNY